MRLICTAAEHRERTKNNLKNFYKDTEDATKKINDEVSMMYRYAQDKDVIIEL